MSWHFLQELEEASWQGSSLDGAPFALLKLIPTAEACCSLGSGTARLGDSQSGTMSGRSTECPGEETLTSSVGVSHARTSHRQEPVEESTASAPVCGKNSPELLARFDHRTYSWRTLQGSLVADLEEFLETFPRWGMMRNGECLALAPLVCHTHETGCSWWPTPRRSWAKSGFGMGQPHRGRYRASVIERCRKQFDWSPTPTFCEWLMAWPVKWTALQPLGTDKFQQWLRLHGVF